MEEAINNIQDTISKLKLILRDNRICILKEIERQNKLEEEKLNKNNIQLELIKLQTKRLRQEQKLKSMKGEKELMDNKITHLKSMLKEYNNKEKLEESIIELEEYLSI